MAASATQKEECVTLKLIVNEEKNKVLFAEAGKDFVDALCSFLTLPLGTITRLLHKESSMMGPITIGSLNSLYQSVKNLDVECMTSLTCKEMLLQPTNPLKDCCSTLKLNIDDTHPINYFTCSNLRCYNLCYLNLSTSRYKYCDGCGNSLIHLVIEKPSLKGFVNADAIFVITDDLTLMPISIDTTSFCLLQNLGITSKSSVKEMTVTVNRKKVLDLLKCSLLSKSPLTDLFLGKKSLPYLQRSSIFSGDVKNSGKGKKPLASLQRSSIFSCDVKNNIQIRLKLVIRKSDRKILFAQGGEDFADFLLSFLTFPLGGAVRVLGRNFPLGSIDCLYKSIVDLDEG